MLRLKKELILARAGLFWQTTTLCKSYSNLVSSNKSAVIIGRR